METIETGIYMGASVFLFIMAISLFLRFVDLDKNTTLLLNQKINREHVIMEIRGYE